MSEQMPDPTGTAKLIPRWVTYAFRGAVAGLVVALATLFVVALFYGHAIGLSPLSCVAVACSVTALFSQPAGLGGMVAGTTIGAVVGGVAHYVSRRWT